MNCTQYENKFDELKNIAELLYKNNYPLTPENIENIACLICKNKEVQVISKIAKHFEALVDKEAYSSIYWYALARVNQSANNMHRAEEAYIKVTNLEPLNSSYLERTARFYVHTNNPSKALEYFNRLITLDSTKQQMANELMIKVYYQSGMYENAISCYESEKEFPNFDSYYELFYSYTQMGKYEKVISHEAKIALDTSDKSYEIMNLLAQSYFSLKCFKESARLYQKLTNEYNPNYKNDLAASLCNSQEYEKAITLFKEILTNNEKDLNALSNYVFTLLKQNFEENYDDALLYSLKAVKNFPNSAPSHSMLGFLYFTKEKYEDALFSLFRAYELDNSKLDDLRSAIKCSVELGKGKTEIGLKLWNILKQKVSLTSDDFLQCGLLYRNNQQYKEAIEKILEAINLEQTNTNYLYILANTFALQKNYSYAEKYYLSALVSDITNINILNSYTDMLLDTKQFQKSIEILLTALKKEKNKFIFNQLGWSYCCAGEYSLACPIFLEAIKLPYNTPIQKEFHDKVTRNLVYAYIMSDDTESLIEIMESKETAHLFDDNFIRFVQAILYIQKDKFDKAEAIAEKVFIEAIGTLPSEWLKLYQALIAFNFKKNDWSNICINTLANLKINTLEYALFKEDICRCLGLAYRENNEHKKALKYFKLATQAGKSNAYNWYHLGLEKISSGNKKQIAETFDIADKCDNSSDVVAIKYLYDKFKRLSSLSHTDKADIILLFYKIGEIVNKIKTILQYTENKPVYHYTRLGVLSNLIKENAKLRLNNAAHMNDPMEGCAFFKILHEAEALYPSTTVIRSQNIFLSSFCIESDELPLWVQYGADGLGCSLEFDYELFDKHDNDFYENITKQQVENSNQENKTTTFPITTFKNQLKDVSERLEPISSNITTNNTTASNNFFENNIANMISSLEVTEESIIDQSFSFMSKILKINFNSESKDLYCLYRVAYINSEKKISNLSDEENKELSSLISLLNSLLKKSKTQFKRSKEVSEIVTQISTDLLSEIQYLFKLDTYSHEKEVRLIKVESIHNKKVNEFSLGDNLPTLYIEMDRKLQFKKCTLGPKVSHPSTLVPALYKNNVIDEVVTSQIKYR